jgi:hypothetical protein
MPVSGKVPAPRLGVFPSPGHALGRGLVWSRAQPLLSTEAIWLGNLSPRLAIKQRPGMPVMKVDCQLLTRAFSGRSYCRLEESLLHFGRHLAPHCSHRFAQS